MFKNRRQLAISCITFENCIKWEVSMRHVEKGIIICCQMKLSSHFIHKMNAICSPGYVHIQGQGCRSPLTARNHSPPNKTLVSSGIQGQRAWWRSGGRSWTIRAILVQILNGNLMNSQAKQEVFARMLQAPNQISCMSANPEMAVT